MTPDLRSAAYDEREFQYRLYMRHRSSFSVLLPNYTPDGWWECDLFGVTRSGYFHEFEIKLTAADFRADCEKRKRNYGSGVPYGQKIPVVDKHQQLASGTARGPAVFWYCVPAGIVTAEEVPAWAGLQVRQPGRNWFSIVKEAPRLHREKVDQTIIRHALGVCYFRYWTERGRYEDLRRAAKEPA